MSEDWSMEDGHLSSDEVDTGPEEDPVDHLDTYEINTGIISDTFRHLRRKASLNSKSNKVEEIPAGDLDYTVKRFVLENVRDIDYRDLATLTGVKPQDMKAFLSRMGVKVPVQGAKRWKEACFRNPDSPEDCAKCAVQSRHSTFYAGMLDCRQCLKENITYWIEEGVPIKIKFTDKM